MSFGTPGIYIQETVPQLNPIIEAGTSTAAFVGFTKRGPTHKATELRSIEDFYRIFGDSYQGETASHAIRGYFNNGGNKAYFVRMSSYNTTTGAETGLAAKHSLTVDASGNLDISFGYRGTLSQGVEGNSYQITVVKDSSHTSSGIGNDLVANAAIGDDKIQLSGTMGIKAGSILRLFDNGGTPGDTSDDKEQISVVRRVESLTENGAVKHYIYLNDALTSAFSSANSIVESLEYSISVLDATGLVLESWSQLSLSNDLPNNLPLVINDPQLGSRYIKVDYTPASGTMGKIDLTDSTLSTGKVLTNGTAEYLNFSSEHFTGTELLAKGLHALDSVTEISLLCCPPNVDPSATLTGIEANSTFHSLILEYCKNRMDLFAILDAPKNKSAAEIQVYRENTLGLESFWGALYYPFVKIQDPSRPQTSATLTVPPSGFVAGVFSRVEGLPAPQGGISAAPAGINEFGRISGVIGIESIVSDNQQAKLNPIGVNCIRLLDRSTGGKGIFIMGARTLSTDDNFKYVPMRRTLTFIEESVRLSTQFALFKKNGPALWNELTSIIKAFLSNFWREGNLAGNRENEAFFVEVNQNTTTSDDIQNGIVRGRIGVSLFRPAEFIIFTFTQTQSGSSVEEN